MFTILLALGTPGFAGSYSSGTFGYTNDDTNWEVYGEAVEDYSLVKGSNLVWTIDEVNLYAFWMTTTSGLPAGAYTAYKFYTDGSATSTDWEKAKNDNIFNDAGDYNYFAGHGSSGAFALSAGYGDNAVTGAETSWGDQDAEVVALATCQSLDASGRTAFGGANLNTGVHYILGMHSSMDDNTTAGGNYAWYLRYGYSVRDAWIAATRDAMASTRTAAYVRFYSSSCNTYGDTAYAVSCDPKASSGYNTATWTL